MRWTFTDHAGHKVSIDNPIHAADYGKFLNTMRKGCRKFDDIMRK